MDKMAYRIEYGSISLRKRMKQIRGTKYAQRTKYILLVCCAIVLSVLSYFGHFDFLIPGNKEITKAAFYNMVEEVEKGESIAGAISAFCEMVLNEDTNR